MKAVEMKADKLYKCECGYVTHYEQALQAHCRFRKHKPMEEKAVEKPIIVKEEPVEEIPAEEPQITVEKKTRRPRKKAVKENDEQ